MTDETAAPTPHPEDQPHSGQPICDTCGQRAVWSEIHGWLHAPADRPFGLPTATDPAKHEVTTTEWMATYDQPARPVSHGTEDSDYREQIARALVPGGDRSTFGRVLDVVAPLVEQLRQARAAYNRMAGHAVDRAAERDRYYLAWQSAARGRRQARQQWQTWQREAEQWQAETVESAKANEGLRAELAAVGRAIECFLGVEYGTPVESARALVERCADAESALDGLRATAVVLPEDWRGQITRALVAWGQAATVRTLGTADTGGPCWDCRGTGHPHDGPCDEPAAAAPVEAETPARPIDMVYLLDQYDRLLSAVEHIRMDTPEDRDRHARVIATFRRAAEPVREQVEGAAPLADLPPEEWRAFHEAATGVDPGPEIPAPTDRKLTENLCVACRQMYAWYGDEALSLIPADHVHAPAVKGVDWKPGCNNPDCESCRRAGRPCDEHMGEADDFCPRCGWHEGHHLPVASPGTGTEAGE